MVNLLSNKTVSVQSPLKRDHDGDLLKRENILQEYLDVVDAAIEEDCLNLVEDPGSKDASMLCYACAVVLENAVDAKLSKNILDEVGLMFSSTSSDNN